MALVLQEEEDDDQPSKPTGCQLAIGIKARTIAASAQPMLRPHYCSGQGLTYFAACAR